MVGAAAIGAVTAAGAGRAPCASLSPLVGMCDTLAVDAHRLPPFESAELVEFKLAAKGCVAVRASRCSLKSARVESSGLFRSLSPRQKDQARAHEPRTDHMILARRYFRIARHDPFSCQPRHAKPRRAVAISL